MLESEWVYVHLLYNCLQLNSSQRHLNRGSVKSDISFPPTPGVLRPSYGTAVCRPSQLTPVVLSTCWREKSDKGV